MKNTLDNMRRFLLSRLFEIGMSLNEASRRIGKNPSYLQQYVKRGSPDILPEDVREKLGPLLGVEPDALRGKPGEDPITPEGGKQVFRGRGAAIRDLPVYKGSTPHGATVMSFEPDRLMNRIDRLSGVASAYAVRLTDDLMAPGWGVGDLALADPSDIPRPGQVAIVETGAGVRVIGIYRSHDDDFVTLADLAGKEVRFPNVDATIAKEVGVIRG